MSQYHDSPGPHPNPNPHPPPPPPSASSHNAAYVPSTPASVAVAQGDLHGYRNRPAPQHLPSIRTACSTDDAYIPSPPSTAVSVTHLSPHFAYNSPRTPSGLNPQSSAAQAPTPPLTSPRTPEMEAYNPRQWSSRNGPVSGSQMVFQQRHGSRLSNTSQHTGMEGTSGCLA
jgi:hypothetical protein